ncbi:helicase SNF [Paenibacillus baekrokdamisoli]|uniref:Helicase SNF n=1 Tax=Paenibacillus baekrokdamisoli TaxID=1712516 RepID=A0A3G9JE02_9BACL|nr:DEAD/DEAH box helicase [Paenibacillus baekrokdamisoli]MBB3071896.1 superfamily II DNA or RNA helicase [Paenibacillus baekrokdamisoli]BBH24121.1 helicase SNF [Paenibacillus baekrokdamisoli]
MSFQLTEKVIKMLCGQTSYEKGEAYYRTGKVTITYYDPETSTYEAVVKANGKDEVTIELHDNGDLEAECSCPTLASYDKYCSHVAAVLVNIQDNPREFAVSASRSHRSGKQSENNSSEGNRQHEAGFGDSSGSVAKDARLLSGILGLFNDKPLRPSRTRNLFDTREPLDVEFICKPLPYGYKKYMFAIELKIGPKRLYIVQKLREFLDRVERRETFAFTKHFTYDPELHSFHPDNDAVIRALIQIDHNERIFRESSSTFPGHASYRDSDRLLPVAPSSWADLHALLTKAPMVKLEQDGSLFEGIQFSEEALPLRYEFEQGQAKDGYQLEVHGLDQIIVMEAYGVVISKGKLLKLQAEQCSRLSMLKQMLEASRTQQIQIGLEQIEPFMEKVIPGLMKLGSVHIAEDVSNRMVQTPLKAKLFLDRVRDRLLAAIEFHYGSIVINPLEGTGQTRGEDRILMRDGDHEERILELMEQSGFTNTEGGYFMNDEDAEYEFLYRIVPQLEKLAHVYATSAVKSKLQTGLMPPKVNVSVDERTDWLICKFEIDGIPDSEIRNLIKSLEEKRKFHRLPSGAFMPLETEEYQEIIRFINETGMSKSEVLEAAIRFPIAHALHFMDSQRQGNTIKLGKSLRQLIDNMRNPDHLDFPVPVSLEPVLRDYQKVGFQWFKTLAHYHFGGILADDMGLGKTVQSIAFLVSVLPEIREQKQPAIIVSPASLVYNWHNELKKFAPEIRVAIADGNQEERKHILKNSAKVDVIITSYPLIRRDILQAAKQVFHTLILDEAQFFKNHATQTAHAVKAIEAKYRFALTGTPVENKLEELWSIFDAVFPALFPSRKVFHDLSRETVAKRVRPFLLRRLKTDVLKELPEKIESIQASELLPEQKKLYVAYLAKLQQETLKHLDQKDFQKNRIKILAGLTRLRQLCCHPALFVEDYAGSSAKFEQLLEIIEECRSAGRRLLVFSQFTEMLGLIGRELGSQGVPFFYLDGKTRASERVELCNKFNEGERDLFLISLKAGGTGLNLTGADTVILYDLWWNPAVEQQAADRAHRIGQKKVVQVIRLMTQGTVEDKMYELQQRKINLIDEVIQPGQEALSSLSEQEIREILMIE